MKKIRNATLMAALNHGVKLANMEIANGSINSKKELNKKLRSIADQIGLHQDQLIFAFENHSRYGYLDGRCPEYDFNSHKNEVEIVNGMYVNLYVPNDRVHVRHITPWYYSSRRVTLKRKHQVIKLKLENYTCREIFNMTGIGSKDQHKIWWSFKTYLLKVSNGESRYWDITLIKDYHWLMVQINQCTDRKLKQKLLAKKKQLAKKFRVGGRNYQITSNRVESQWLYTYNTVCEKYFVKSKSSARAIRRTR